MKIINSFLLALLLSTTSLFAQTDLKNGLVACYPFNANARDESGNANNGMVNGATLTTDRFGKVNNAYYFDGISNYIEISADKLQTETFSYSLWVKPSSIPSEGIAYFLFSVGSDNGDQAIGLNKGYTNGTDGFTGGGYLDIGENSFCQKGTSPNINQWYNVIFVREVDKYKVYLDGELICTTALVTKKPFYGNGTVKAIIGGRNNYGQFAHCSLDDIYIYNRAITGQEVSELYEVTKSPTAVDLKSGLVACYPFNANANDATGNGNNGTVNGATLTTDRFGKANSAYNFNGSSLISVNPAQFKNQSYTYATWVYLDNLPAVVYFCWWNWW
jgi:Concanavalin A-like lectin/glucanases superfamily